MEKVNLMQIGVYNPQRQNAYLTEALFVARKSEFKSIMEGLEEETPNSIPQHYLIIGQRGMGKTTLLKRIDIELQKDMYNKRYIPVLLPEEQYNLNKLADFWLNCLYRLLEHMFENNLDSEENMDTIDKEIDRIMKENKDSFYLCESLYIHFTNVCKKLHRRPVLLLDNIGLALDRLNINEKNLFRGYLSKKECPIIIGAGVVMAGVSEIKEHIIEYKAPFYDFFQSYKLKKLNAIELIEIINRLSEITQIGITMNTSNSVRLESLFQLTGGNPRNVVILFKLLIRGLSETIVEDLEALIDESTPLNKSRFEELPTQQQIILNAIAQNWDPIHISDIVEVTRLKNNQISPHLNHLIATGWIETTKIDTNAWESKAKNSVDRKKKGNVYSLSERFLAIWLILRNGRLQKKNEIRKVLESYVWLFYSDVDEQNIIDEIEKACKEKDYRRAMDLVENITDETMKFFIEGDILLESENYLDVENQNVMDEIEKTCKEKDYKRAMDLTENIIDENIKLSIKGDILFESENYPDAEKMYRDALKSNKKNDINWFSLSICLFKQKKFPEAEKAVRKAISLDKINIEYWHLLGVNLFYQGKYLEAEDVFRKNANEDKKNYHCQFYLGLSLFGQQKYKESEKAFVMAIKLNNKNVYCWSYLGESQLIQKKFKESIKSLKKAIKLAPNDTYTYYIIGLTYLETKDFEKAIESFETYIRLGENDKCVYCLLGMGYLEIKDYKKAIESFETSIKLGENDKCVYCCLGYAYNMIQNHNKAIEVYKEACDLYPDAICLVKEKGQTYLNSFDFDKAIDCFSEVIRLNRDDASNYNDRGAVYSKINDSKKALEDFSKAIELDNNYKFAYVNRGHEYTYGELKNYNKAIEDFNKAIELNHFNSKKYLIHLYRDINKQLYEAEELFDTINPDDIFRDVYLLEKVLFELHKHNAGIATNHLLEALNGIKDNLNPKTKNDWEYFSAITIKIGYAHWLLDIFSKTGFKTNVSPLYVAIQALEIERKKGQEMKEIYLKNQAIEKSDPARVIMEKMKKYLYE